MGVYNRLKYLCPPLLNLPCSALMCQKRNQREEDHMDEKKLPAEEAALTNVFEGE